MLRSLYYNNRKKVGGIRTIENDLTSICITNIYINSFCDGSALGSLSRRPVCSNRTPCISKLQIILAHRREARILEPLALLFGYAKAVFHFKKWEDWYSNRILKEKSLTRANKRLKKRVSKWLYV